MLELAARILPMLDAGTEVAVATAIDAVGSTPLRTGSSMAVPKGGPPAGQVSGGCVEAAVLEECRLLLAGGPSGVRRFGFGDAAGEGASCGGEVDVLMHRLVASEIAPVLRAAAAGEPAAVGLVTAGPPELIGAVVTSATADRILASMPGASPARLIAAVDAQRALGASAAVVLDCGRAVLRLFVDVAAPPRRLLISGATEVGAALAALAGVLGLRVTICDPRPDFASADRFPAAHEVVVGRAHDLLVPGGSWDAVCVLGHDEELDPLTIAAALESGAGYVGALGSRATAARCRERLRLLGVSPAAIARLRSPIGLDLGGGTPAAVALAVLAEVQASAAGADPVPLTHGTGPIHRAAHVPA